jgi:hypothetical protein
LDANIALVAVTLIGIVVPVLKWLDDRSNRREQAKREAKVAELAAVVAKKVEETKQDLQANTTNVNGKLDTIHNLVNSQLTEAVERFKDALKTIEELKALLKEKLPDDPRVQSIVQKHPGGGVSE